MSPSNVHASEEYLGAVVSETLRLFPPVPVTMRHVNQPYRLGVYEIEPGILIAVNSYSLQRRPDLWPEPDRFLPERFLGEPPAKYTWNPFGGGARHCIGRSFATTEIHVVLRTLLRQARLAPADPADEGIVRHGAVISPSRGARAVLLERAPVTEATGDRLTPAPALGLVSHARGGRRAGHQADLQAGRRADHQADLRADLRADRQADLRTEGRPHRPRGSR